MQPSARYIGTCRARHCAGTTNRRAARFAQCRCRALRGKRARHWLYRLGWRPLETCEPALESEKAPEHRVSLESNERKFPFPIVTSVLVTLVVLMSVAGAVMLRPRSLGPRRADVMTDERSFPRVRSRRDRERGAAAIAQPGHSLARQRTWAGDVNRMDCIWRVTHQAAILVRSFV